MIRQIKIRKLRWEIKDLTEYKDYLEQSLVTTKNNIESKQMELQTLES